MRSRKNSLLLGERKSQKIPLAISPSDHYDLLLDKNLFNARIADFIQNGKLVVPCHTMMAFLVDKYKQSFRLLNSP